MAVKEEKWSDLIWPRVRCSPAVQGQWPFSGEIKDSHSEAHLIICEIHIQKLIHKHHPRERSGARNISVPLTHAFLKLLRLSTFTYITNAITVFYFYLSHTHWHTQTYKSWFACLCQACFCNLLLTERKMPGDFDAGCDDALSWKHQGQSHYLDCTLTWGSSLEGNKWPGKEMKKQNRSLAVKRG